MPWSRKSNLIASETTRWTTFLHQRPPSCTSSYQSCTSDHLPAPATTFLHQRLPSCTSSYQSYKYVNNSVGFLFLFVENLFSVVTLCGIGTSNMSYNTSIRTSCLVWSPTSLQLINMTLIFLFWAACHVNKSSSPFRDHTIRPKTFTLPIRLAKHIVSNIKCLSFVVWFILPL